jgi:hypothetical protein
MKDAAWRLQSWTGWSSRLDAGALRFVSLKPDNGFPFPVNNPCGMIDEEWTPIGSVFGKQTRTRQRQPARPEEVL